jgi:hypothetical protein
MLKLKTPIESIQPKDLNTSSPAIGRAPSAAPSAANKNSCLDRRRFTPAHCFNNQTCYGDRSSQKIKLVEQAAQEGERRCNYQRNERIKPSGGFKYLLLAAPPAAIRSGQHCAAVQMDYSGCSAGWCRRLGGFTI